MCESVETTVSFILWHFPGLILHLQLDNFHSFGSWGSVVGRTWMWVFRVLLAAVWHALCVRSLVIIPVFISPCEPFQKHSSLCLFSHRCICWCPERQHGEIPLSTETWQQDSCLTVKSELFWLFGNFARCWNIRALLWASFFVATNLCMVVTEARLQVCARQRVELPLHWCWTQWADFNTMFWCRSLGSFLLMFVMESLGSSTAGRHRLESRSKILLMYDRWTLCLSRVNDDNQRWDFQTLIIHLLHPLASHKWCCHTPWQSVPRLPDVFSSLIKVKISPERLLNTLLLLLLGAVLGRWRGQTG